MKTLTLLGCITCLSAALSACGTDPVILGEILDSAGEGSSDTPRSDDPPASEPPSEESPPTPEDEPADEDPYPAPNEPEESDPNEELVLEILRVNCGACHIGSGASAEFGTVDSIDAMIESGMIEPGSRENSRLYIRMVDQTMPPAFERQQRPTEGQIEFIGEFIDQLE